VFDRSIVEECRYNWKEFLEIFLELYHVEAAHPGLQNWVDAGNYEWGFGDRWSYQILGVNDELRVQTSANYERYRDAILQYSGGKLPKYATVWSILYPNVMIEWYPFALVVSTLIPRGPDHTSNVVEFYYPEEIHAFERPIVEAHQACYAESAAEDAQICVRLHEGRRALWLAGEDDVGPYHTPHEDGMIHCTTGSGARWAPCGEPQLRSVLPPAKDGSFGGEKREDRLRVGPLEHPPRHSQASRKLTPARQAWAAASMAGLVAQVMAERRIHRIGVNLEPARQLGGQLPHDLEVAGVKAATHLRNDLQQHLVLLRWQAQDGKSMPFIHRSSTAQWCSRCSCRASSVAP